MSKLKPIENTGVFLPIIPIDLLEQDWRAAFEYTRSKIVGAEKFSDAYVRFPREWIQQIIVLQSGYDMEKDWLGVFRLYSGLYMRLDFGYCRPRRA
ncbi:MAG: hypothetical protein HY231_24005 [Acidobacteria bacterium]|nr:hypothetical protein [Acidobacteriota bacterium]